MLKTHLQQQRKQIDFQLLLTVSLLSGFGLLMVYDASLVQALKDFKDGYFYIKQQLIWIILGFFSLFLFSFFD